MFNTTCARLALDTSLERKSSKQCKIHVFERRVGDYIEYSIHKNHKNHNCWLQFIRDVLELNLGLINLGLTVGGRLEGWKLNRGTAAGRSNDERCSELHWFTGSVTGTGDAREK